jgi:TetR/AcrR family transcriptional regulator
MQKQNKPSDSYSKILTAARKIFSKEGFDGARMDEIALLANVNKAMIYYHFKSKEELYRKVIDSLFRKDDFYKELNSMTSLSSWEKLEKIINRISELVELNAQERCSIIARELVSKSDTFFFMRDTYWIPDFKMVRSILEEGVKRGEFETQESLDFITFTIFSHLIYYRINEVTYKDSEIFSELYPPDRKEKIVNYLKELLKKLLF